MVLGADTYRMFVGYWPTPASKDEIIAPSLNGLRRIVFSTQLRSAPWLVEIPVAIGAGRGVFPPEQDPHVLDLQSATTHDRGLVELVYAFRARS